MPSRPAFIKSAAELTTDQSYSYPGDTETFGTGAALSRKLGLKRIAVNYEILAPGDRSSWPHAHSKEEEFLFVLEGNPQVWVDGVLHDLKPGDCVAFVPGDGYAHCLINNSGETVKAIVVGESEAPEDKIFYPLHPARNQEMKDKGAYWEAQPRHEIGPHDGYPDRKRPAKKLT